MSDNRCSEVNAHECNGEPCAAHCIKWSGHDGSHTDGAHIDWEAGEIMAADPADMQTEVVILLREAARRWLQIHPEFLRPSEGGELPGVYGEDDNFTVAAEGAYGSEWLDAMDEAGVPLQGRPDQVAPGHVVYRHYTAEDILLYVGYTARYTERQGTHRREAPWWSESARVTVEPHTTRDEALQAELEAIRTEHPLWNVQGRSAR